MSDSGIAYYLYCLTPCGCGIRASAIGVDGQRPVSVRACGGIGAVLSEVELGEFCGESAEARLQDLAWLGPRVCRHEAVIEEVMSQAPVLPARFATLFTSVDRLQQTVLEHREAIAGFFAQLGDKQEWAVKGLLNRAGALERLVSSGQPAAEEPAPVTSPGARYFQEKRIKVQLERDFNLRLREFCGRAAAALGAHAGGFLERKVLAPDAAGADAEGVLNWAFLLSPAALEDFRVRLDRFHGGEAFPGLILALTGPWPPYSFAPDLSGGAKA
jgi:hypothetical protein